MNAPTKSTRPWRIIAVVVVLLLAVTVWLIAVPLYKRNAAIQALKRWPAAIVSQSIAPAWLENSGVNAWLRRVGIDLDRVEIVNFCLRPADEEALRHIAQLTNVKELGLAGARVADEDLVHLRALTNLRMLALFNTEVSDNSLVHLAQLVKLEELHLRNTRISDDGLEQLAGLSNLEFLDIRWCDDVSDDGVEALQTQLPQCEIVW